jgi:hypothetical protein
VKNIFIQGVAVLRSLCAVVVAEQYLKRLWVWTTPSGNREIYHGPASDLFLILVLGVVAVVI